MDPEAKRNHAEMGIIAAFCGQIAVECFSHHPSQSFYPNLVSRDLYDSARQVSGGEEEADAMLYWLWCHAEHVFAKDGIWQGVGFLADELIKSRTLDGKRAKEIYDKALAAAK